MNISNISRMEVKFADMSDNDFNVFVPVAPEKLAELVLVYGTP